MRMLRRMCIGFVALGSALLFARRDSGFDTLPFPGVGLTVKMLAKVKTAGDYRINVSMPKADQALALAPETISCSLAVSIKEDGRPPINSEITSLSRYGEYGFARIQYYSGGRLHLTPGEYVVEISSRDDCRAAMSRGATLSLEQEMIHPTERFIGSVLAYWGGVLLLGAGLLGIILYEFKKA
jgi:hypothetical protein